MGWNGVERVEAGWTPRDVVGWNGVESGRLLLRCLLLRRRERKTRTRRSDGGGGERPTATPVRATADAHARPRSPAPAGARRDAPENADAAHAGGTSPTGVFRPAVIGGDGRGGRRTRSARRRRAQRPPRCAGRAGGRLRRRIWPVGAQRERCQRRAAYLDRLRSTVGARFVTTQPAWAAPLAACARAGAGTAAAVGHHVWTAAPAPAGAAPSARPAAAAGRVVGPAAGRRGARRAAGVYPKGQKVEKGRDP